MEVLAQALHDEGYLDLQETSSQDPQNAIEHGSVLPPRAPATVFAACQLWQEGPNQNPLLVSEVA
jgi:hypothetical protein